MIKFREKIFNIGLDLGIAGIIGFGYALLKDKAYNKPVKVKEDLSNLKKGDILYYHLPFGLAGEKFNHFMLYDGKGNIIDYAGLATNKRDMENRYEYVRCRPLKDEMKRLGDEKFELSNKIEDAKFGRTASLAIGIPLTVGALAYKFQRTKEQNN